MKNTNVLNILNIINNAKLNWCVLEIKLIWNSNKNYQHSEQPNQGPADRKNQTIPDYQSLYGYPTYLSNSNIDNYEFFINFFNSTFFITSYSANFPFIYPQNTQTYQYPQTGNEKW